MECKQNCTPEDFYHAGDIHKEIIGLEQAYMYIAGNRRTIEKVDFVSYRT